MYITVQWDYHSATTHPEWLIREASGAHEGDAFTKPGFYQSLCVNTGYFDFLKEQTIEVIELLGDELDGLFFDIVGIRPCLCAACRKEMAERGIDMTDDNQVREFAKLSIDRFKHRMTEIIRERNKTCSIFYNAGHVGPCTRDSADDYTHFELESLPSGGWGYLHFPVTARYARKLGKDCMGMTGKFHTSWGDFHSLKNVAALKFRGVQDAVVRLCLLHRRPTGALRQAQPRHLPADWQGIRPVRRARTVGASLHTADRGRAYDRRKRSG